MYVPLFLMHHPIVFVIQVSYGEMTEP